MTQKRQVQLGIILTAAAFVLALIATLYMFVNGNLSPEWAVLAGVIMLGSLALGNAFAGTSRDVV